MLSEMELKVLCEGHCHVHPDKAAVILKNARDALGRPLSDEVGRELITVLEQRFSQHSKLIGAMLGRGFILVDGEGRIGVG